MWSLPDINRMNAEAKKDSNKFERAIRTGKLDRKKIRCEYDDVHCSGDVRLEPWYDIFSDDIKGLIARCEYHGDREGTPEGFFWCDGCGRIIAENYTWELYYTMVGDTQLCLPCAAADYLADDNNWIELTYEKIDALDFNAVRKAKHVIGVKMPIPKGIRFVNNVEFDSTDGHCISGGGVEELKDTLRQLKEEGENRAILILDAAYQFAVSIAVYAPVKAV